MKSVVMQACYGILSMSKEFNLLTFKYDVITGQCNVCDIREKFLLIFITLSHVRLVYVYACFNSLFSFFSLFLLFCFFTLRCIVLYCVVLPEWRINYIIYLLNIVLSREHCICNRL